MDLQIRPLTGDDIPAAGPVLNAAFRADTSYEPELRRYLRLQPDGWFLATVDGQAAGTVGAFDHGPFAWLGLMSVAPALQGRGIARALLGEMLAWLDDRRCPLVLLDASAAGAPLYPRYGFVDRDDVVVYQRAAGAVVTGLRAASVHAMAPTDLGEVAAFDAPLFGADRGRVLGAYLQEFPGRAFLSRDAGGQVDGYLIAQPRRIGPWVAASAAAAAALLAAALTLPAVGSLAALTPAANTSGADLLTDYGFSRQRALRHMGRGHGAYSGRRACIYGQASFALG